MPQWLFKTLQGMDDMARYRYKETIDAIVYLENGLRDNPLRFSEYPDWLYEALEAENLAVKLEARACRWYLRVRVEGTNWVNLCHGEYLIRETRTGSLRVMNAEAFHHNHEEAE